MLCVCIYIYIYIYIYICAPAAPGGADSSVIIQWGPHKPTPPRPPPI